MSDYKTQRLNMVESQVRPSDVTDRRLIRAMGVVARELYVPERAAAIAYMDSPVPLAVDAAGRATRELLAPRTFAKLAQSADLDPEDAILVAGCGGGYSLDVLSRVVRKVTGVEADAALAERARTQLKAQSITNASVQTGAIAAGSPADSPYDAIIVEGAVSDVPKPLLDQLKDGGRLVVIVGNRAVGKAVVWTRAGSTYGQRDVFDATASVLPGFERAATFAL